MVQLYLEILYSKGPVFGLSTCARRAASVNWKERGKRNKGSYKHGPDHYQGVGRNLTIRLPGKRQRDTNWMRRRRREYKRISTLARVASTRQPDHLDRWGKESRVFGDVYKNIDKSTFDGRKNLWKSVNDGAA